MLCSLLSMYNGFEYAKGKFQKKHEWEKKETSVLLMLFYNGNERCHITDRHVRMSGTQVFKCKQHTLIYYTRNIKTIIMVYILTIYPTEPVKTTGCIKKTVFIALASVRRLVI